MGEQCDECDSLLSQLDEANAEIDRLKDTVRSLEMDIEDLRIELSEVRSETEQLETERNKQTQKADLYYDKIQELKLLVKHLEIDIARYEERGQRWLRPNVG